MHDVQGQTMAALYGISLVLLYALLKPHSIMFLDVSGICHVLATPVFFISLLIFPVFSMLCDLGLLLLSQALVRVLCPLYVLFFVTQVCSFIPLWIQRIVW